MTTPTLPDLPAQIINLPDEVAPEGAGDAFCRGYRFGHRDARHAAAELVGAALSAAPAAVPVAFDAEGFRAWVLRELPDDTIIGKGAWWADHLTKCVQWFVRPAAPVAPFNVEAMLTACIPGGASCDPQQVADAIRAYCAAPAAPTATTRGGWFIDAGQSNIGVLWEQVERGTDGAVWLSADAAAVGDVQPVAPFLFIAMDDDKRAHLTWCANEAEVHAAVSLAMFWLHPGENLSPDHEEALAANVEELLDSGALTFEGDAPLYLYRVAGAPTVAQQAAEPQPAMAAAFRVWWGSVTSEQAAGFGGSTEATALAAFKAGAAHAQQQAATVQPLSEETLGKILSGMNAALTGFRGWRWLDFAHAIETACAAAWGLTLAGTATQQAPTDTDTAKD